MKLLHNCQWKPRWVSHMGCIKGCLEYLGINISDAWLYGGTGHAFVINLHEGVCPSGPTAWNTMKLFELGNNLGYKIEGIFSSKSQADFAQSQKQAWEHVQHAINQDKPCYGWELEIPEFYVIYGYDDVGYYFSGPGCDDGKGPKRWQEVGDTGIGVMELYSVWPDEVSDNTRTVIEALTFALSHASPTTVSNDSPYKTGLAGYDNWMTALQQGKASDMGMRYNTGVWLECRQFAVAFLKEAKKRLLGQADAVFDEAISHYTAVADNLDKIARVYPWAEEASAEDLLPVDNHSDTAITALHQAKQAEGNGLLTLEKIIKALSSL